MGFRSFGRKLKKIGKGALKVAKTVAPIAMKVAGPGASLMLAHKGLSMAKSMGHRTRLLRKPKVPVIAQITKLAQTPRTKKEATRVPGDVASEMERIIATGQVKEQAARPVINPKLSQSILRSGLRDLKGAQKASQRDWKAAGKELLKVHKAKQKAEKKAAAAAKKKAKRTASDQKKAERVAARIKKQHERDAKKAARSPRETQKPNSFLDRLGESVKDEAFEYGRRKIRSKRTREKIAKGAEDWVNKKLGGTVKEAVKRGARGGAKRFLGPASMLVPRKMGSGDRADIERGKQYLESLARRS